MNIDILVNPNIAYLLLVTGFVLGMMAVFSPGTGLLEAGALLCFLMAGAMVLYLPINWWALVILILGVFPFLLAVRYSKKLYFLVISIVALIIGSVFLFDGPTWAPVVNPILATVTSILVAGFFWIVATKYLQVASQPPSINLEALIGQVGEARTDLNEEGSIYISGELWSARSNQPIPAGSHVRVIERQGLILIVEPIVPPGK